MSVSARFSEAEQLVIRDRRLEDFIVLKRQPDSLSARRRAFFGLKPAADDLDLLVADLMNGRPNRFLCDTPVHAKAYAWQLAKALKSLKLFIADNELVSGARAFDL
ncbi:MAG TPA: hypothetical protein VMF32_13155 [Xanthobacteraceae bacterium]|nr:hypothetical protein [Xanthobacteraceae bacterium]